MSESCDHTLGSALILNPEEGDAWVHRLIKVSFKHKVMPLNDFETGYVWQFRHCPDCGAVQEPQKPKQEVAEDE